MSVEKRAIGLKGFPTPDTAADEDAYLLFLLPDGLWGQYILGACKALVYDWNWFEAGDLLPEEASEALRLIVQQAPYNLLPNTSQVDAPYWDDADGDDAGESFDPDAQPWYDDLAEVFLTGFLSTLVTPAAAVTFITVTRRLRIAFRTNNYGGIMNLFVDGDPVATVDTYSAAEDIGFVDVIVPA